MACRIVSSDPEFILNMLDEIDSDASDDDFDGYIDEEDMCMREMEENGEVMKPKESEGDKIGNNNELRDNGEGGGMDVDNDEDGGMDVDSVPSSDDIPAFDGSSSGATEDISGDEPVDIYQKFITNNMIQLILRETNLYGDQYVDSHINFLQQHPRARAQSFIRRKFTAQEITRFIVLVITMGIVNLPSLQHYWSTAWPFVSNNANKIMSRDRFLLILKFLHLADNSKASPRGTSSYDKLYKLREFLNIIIIKFKTMFSMNRELSIEESIIGYKGRLSFLQYMPKKPTKWGMKAWVLADSATGYVWNWKLYCGKVTSEEKARQPLAEKVVLDLLTGLEGKGHHIYFDNFYTSLSLCKQLFKLGYGSCGTVRINRRGIPRDFQAAKLKKGETTTFRDGRILGLKWMDKRLVSMISTIHDDSMINTDRRTRLAPTGVEKISKPLVIDKYNTYMGGDDKSDQLVIYYAFSHSSKKWWKRIFFHMIEVSLVNAYILYTNSTHAKKMSHLDFRVVVAKGLLEKLPSLLQPPPPALHGQFRLTSVGNHFMEPTTGRPDCKVCSDRSAGKRKQTQLQCKLCKIALCAYPCFEKFHTLKKYK